MHIKGRKRNIWRQVHRLLLLSYLKVTKVERLNYLMALRKILEAQQQAGFLPSPPLSLFLIIWFNFAFLWSPESSSVQTFA